jgi:hypothetical protein
MASLVTFTSEGFDVRVDVRLQRRGQHGARSLQGDLVEHHPRLRAGAAPEPGSTSTQVNATNAAAETRHGGDYEPTVNPTEGFVQPPSTSSSTFGDSGCHPTSLADTAPEQNRR